MLRTPARHLEDFAHHDFYVTAYAEGEKDYTQITDYISDGENISDTDIVLWYAAPVLHIPRDEDGMFIGGRWTGAALVMWSRTLLRPRNIHDRTPFFPY